MSTYVHTLPPGAWNVASQARPTALPAAGTRPTWSLEVVTSMPGLVMYVPRGKPIQSPAGSDPR